MSRIEDGGAVEAGGNLAAWLEAAAAYFEKRPTNGEDRAHWANVFNAENCRAAAAEITRLRAENAGMQEALDGIANTLSALRMQAEKDGGGRDGRLGAFLSNDTAYLIRIAALSNASQAEGQTR